MRAATGRDARPWEQDGGLLLKTSTVCAAEYWVLSACWWQVRVVQLEVTRKRPQTCANVRMLRNLLLLGFDLYMVRACH